MRCFFTAVAALLAVATAATDAAAQLAPPDRNRPANRIVVATNRALAPAVRHAAKAYERAHPNVRITVVAPGSDVAMAELAVNHADLAIIGREATDSEVKAIEWIYRKPPVSLAEMPGVPFRVIVNRANPLRTLILSQLARLFDPTAPTPYWRDLGVSGSFADQPVRLVIPNLATNPGHTLQHLLQSDRTQIAWERIDEAAFRPITQANGHIHGEVLDNITSMGIILGDANRKVKIIKLNQAEDNRFRQRGHIYALAVKNETISMIAIYINLYM